MSEGESVMAEVEVPLTRRREVEPRLRTARQGGPITAEMFREIFGETLQGVLDPRGWRSGYDVAREYERIETEVRQATELETQVQRSIREQIFPRLSEPTHDPVPGAGVHKITPEEVRQIHERLLFPGRVEAADGTCEVHDTLPLTIYSLGVSLVSYHGGAGTWGMKLFRRDLRQRHEDPVAFALEVLERRDRREALNHESNRDPLSQLARRALMAYAERSVLVRDATAPWRMGHGNPCAFELLSGGGCADLMIESIRLLIKLIDHRKFVFVASEPADRFALTVGDALHPLEFAVLGRLSERLEAQVEQINPGGDVTVDDEWLGTRLPPEKWLRMFTDDHASKVVYGVYRATRLSPAQLFYAHEDYFHEAARIAVADSFLQETRGFPLLIDLADQTCRSVYGGGGLREMADAAYVRSGQPFRYHSERSTRGQRGDI
jgi:hypothetical protein